MLIGSEYDSAQRAIYMFNKYKTCNNNKHTNKNNNNKTTTVKYHPYNMIFHSCSIYKLATSTNCTFTTEAPAVYSK